MRLAELLGLPYVQEVIATRHALEQLIPEADVAIELGGEDAKIIYLTDGVEQRMNGACAGGTGGFIDLMCGMLGVKAREFNALALGAQTIYPIASRCAVFAQTDVRPLINEGARRSDIAASVLQAVVTQTVAGLSCGRAIRGTVVFLGGPLEVYSELVTRFRVTLGLTRTQAIKPPEAHLFVAKGAALYSGETPTASVTQGLTRNLALESAGSLRVKPWVTGWGAIDRRLPGHGLPSTVSLSELELLLAAAPLEEEGGIERLGALFSSDEERAAFKERHARIEAPRARLMDVEGPLFVGLDAGSTTVKLVAVDEQGRILYSSYEHTHGDVIGTTREALEDLYASLPHEYGGEPLLDIGHITATGYGEQLLTCAFNLDSGEVETIAHLRAAQELNPEVDYVLDIGGQDIKCMRIQNGAVDEIMLNEACSSGCGALIEGFSRTLGYTRWSFSDVALTASNPVDLGTRCTVFMTSRVRHAQKEGIRPADIAAGLAYSVVRNALYKVICCTDPSTLGTRVMVQGGTFLSDAVLRAFELETGLEVQRPRIANLMGAFGAALIARDRGLAQGRAGDGRIQSSSLSRFELATLKQKQTTRRCQGCTNNCLLTVSSFTSAAPDDFGGQETSGRQEIAAERGASGQGIPGERGFSGGQETSGRQEIAAERATPAQPHVFIVGNRCERGLTDGKPSQNARHLPNLFKRERELLRRTSRHNTGMLHIAPVVGLPAVLELYGTLPFWSACFGELGYVVLISEDSTAAVYRKGAHAVMSEGVCYPAKLAHGHVMQLIEQGADVIFMPAGGPVGAPPSANNCPVSRAYAQLIADDVAARGGIGFLTCDLESATPLAEQLSVSLTKAGMHLPAEEDLKRALAAGEQAQQEYAALLAEGTAQALRRIEAEGLSAIVLAGHPYHTDLGLSHGIDELLGELGFVVLSASGLLAHKRSLGEQGDERDERGEQGEQGARIAAMWTRAQELYAVAEIVAQNPRLELVQLYSFGCGVDALSSAEVRAIIEGAGKLYTALKVDEMVDLAAIRIRLRSLAAVLKERREAPHEGSHEAPREESHEAPPAPRHSAHSAQNGGAYEVSRGEPGGEPTQQPPLADSNPTHRTLNQPSPEDDSAGSGAEPENATSSTTPTLILPALAPEHAARLVGIVALAGYHLHLLPELTNSDVASGLRHLSNDLCHPIIALAGQVIDWARRTQPQQEVTLLVPQVCAGCRAIELENLIRRQLKIDNKNSTIRVFGIPSQDKQLTLPAHLAASIYDELMSPLSNPLSSPFPEPQLEHHASPPPQRLDAKKPHTPQCPDAGKLHALQHSSGIDVPRIGVIGNAGMLYTPYLNRSMLERIRAEGYEPVLPPLTTLMITNTPLERHISHFVQAGIHDIVVLQSFGCLNGHIHGRGAAKRLKQRYPEVNITFIDFDAGASEINQLNRLKLALTLARERELIGKPPLKIAPARLALKTEYDPQNEGD
jgi:predicted CoA-substrate-specific enzyme activase